MHILERIKYLLGILGVDMFELHFSKSQFDEEEEEGEEEDYGGRQPILPTSEEESDADSRDGHNQKVSDVKLFKKFPSNAFNVNILCLNLK